MTTANPFIKKAENQQRNNRSRAILLGHLKQLEGLLARYENDPGPGKDRIAARVEEAKAALRKLD